MSEPSYNLYFNLLPPSAFLREANKIACWAFLITLGFAILWSKGGVKDSFWQGTLADVVAIQAASLGLWFLCVLLITLSRLWRYMRAARQLSKEAYFLAYPWANLCVMSFTAFAAVICNNWGRPFSLVKVLVAEAVPFAVAAGSLAAQVPVLSDILSKLNLVHFGRELLKGLPLMLGPQYNESRQKYVTQVIEFQHLFVPLMRPGTGGEPATEESPYYSADTLDQFQRTLTCSYETGRYLGRVVSKTFKTGWTMVDVGGAEGVFTREVLSQCKTPPSTIWLVEPAEENVQSYLSMIEQTFPGVQVRTHTNFIENVVADLPEVDLVLASHSLYSVMDRDRMATAGLVHDLIRKATRGFCYLSMASKTSQSYEVKRRVLSFLNVKDRSSFGEDLRELVPKGYRCTQVYRDSLIEVTDVLKFDERLLPWVAYFCRVPPARIRPHLSYCRKVILDTALEFGKLPAAQARRYASADLVSKLGLRPDSMVLLHKELLIQVYKKNVPVLGKV